MSEAIAPTPEAIIAVLRTHSAELQQSGIRHVSLFGSLARGEAHADSDVDLVVELDPDARIGLIRLVAWSSGWRRFWGDRSIFCRNPSSITGCVPMWRGTAAVPSDHDPAACFMDILENIDRISGYVAGMTEDEFRGDGRTWRDAVERCLERICEAAYRLGADAARLVPSEPWGKIRGMGNRLRHGYDRVSFRGVWLAVQDELPALENDVRIALAGMSGSGTRQ